MANRQILNIKNLGLVVLIILIAALIRILPHPANFTPIAAMALFGGATLPRKYALFLPLSAMFLSDIFIGFHSTLPYVYGSFMLTSFIGMWLKTRKNIPIIIGATLISSVLFFLITNFGVWMQGVYDPGINGLWQSYLMGIPFFRNTLLGDLFYTATFFVIYQLVVKKAFRQVYSSS